MDWVDRVLVWATWKYDFVLSQIPKSSCITTLNFLSPSNSFTPWWCLLKSRANLQQPKRPPRREGKISRPDGKVPCWPPSRPPPSSETIKLLRNEYQKNLRRMRPELGQDKSNFLVVLARNNLFLKRIEKNYLPTLSFISRQGGSNFQVECKKPRILFQLKRLQNWPYLSQ